MPSSRLNMGTVRVDDSILTIVGRKEGEKDSYIEQMKDKFEIAVEDRVVIKGNWDDDIWILTDERVERTIRFKPEIIPLGGISLEDYATALKCAVVESLYDFVILSIQRGARSIEKAMIATNGFSKLEILNEPDYQKLTDGRNRFMFVSFFAALGFNDEGIEEIFGPCVWKKEGRRRYMAEFVSYFLFERILYREWDRMTDDKKIEYFPIYLYWRIGNIIPQRVEEFALMPYNGLSFDGRYDLVKLRRSRGKNSKGGGVGHKKNRDFTTADYPILKELADLIGWYQEKTDGIKRKAEDCQLIFFSKRKNICKNSSSSFAELLRRFYDEYFMDYTVLSKKEYLNRYWSCDTDETRSLYSGETVRIELGDIRVISMINLVQSGCNPTMIRRFTGHETQAMDDWYSGNLSSYLKSQAVRELRDEGGIDIIDEISQRRKYFLFKDRQGTEVDCGICYSDVFPSDCWDCLKVDFKCENCEFCIRDMEREQMEQSKKEMNERALMIESKMKRFEYLLNIKDPKGNDTELGTLTEQLRSEMNGFKAYYKNLLMNTMEKKAS